jgi:hypothetical protein
LLLGATADDVDGHTEFGHYRLQELASAQHRFDEHHPKICPRNRQRNPGQACPTPDVDHPVSWVE